MPAIGGCVTVSEALPMPHGKTEGLWDCMEELEH